MNKSKMLKEAYSYEDAVDYIESQGVSCDPGDYTGELVCDLLDDNADGYNQDDEPTYKKSTLNYIVKRGKEDQEERLADLEAEDPEGAQAFRDKLKQKALATKKKALEYEIDTAYYEYRRTQVENKFLNNNAAYSTFVEVLTQLSQESPKFKFSVNHSAGYRFTTAGPYPSYVHIFYTISRFTKNKYAVIVTALREAGCTCTEAGPARWYGSPYKVSQDGDEIVLEYRYQAGHDGISIDVAMTEEEEKQLLMSEEEFTQQYLKEKGIIDESLKEASYGGAFDIEDNQFFTRDDLNELMDDINDRCRTQFPERGMEAIEAYMSEDGKTLEVVMEDADYGEESVFIPVDMRSIRKPSDLLKYSNRVIKEFIRQADNFNAYYDHVNSFYGEQLDEALGEGPADFIVPVYTVDEEVELKDKLAEVEVTLGELYDEYGKDRIDYLLKRANYASYVREHRLGYALEHLISDLAIKKFREANPEYAHELLSNDRPVILNGNLVDSGVEELGKVLGKKLLPHLGEAWEDDWYFGKEEADKYKDLILDNLSGKKISKSRDLAYAEGGIAYEANKLGLDLFELLRALEGGCYQGWVKEIDDSTYKVMPSGYSDQDNLALYGEGLR